QMGIIWRGMEAVKRLESWGAPLVSIGFVILLIWILVEAGGFGPIFSQESQLGWGTEFWSVFAPSLMGMIAFWATLSLNMSDFTRFGEGQRKQVWGQILGLPTTMSFIAIMSIMITSGGIVVYGEAIWDPVQLASRFDSPIVVVAALIGIVLATVTTNLAANVVSPSYDFSNAFPRRISFRTGGLITGVIGIVVQPWRLISDPNIYIYAWLSFYGGVLATIAGVLAAGYWVKARRMLSLTDLFAERGGRYWYTAGWNWRAFVATAVGAVLAVGGAYSAPGAGPFPEHGLIPFLQPVYDSSWTVGRVSAFRVYLVLPPTAHGAASLRYSRRRFMNDVIRAGLIPQRWTGDKDSMIAASVDAISRAASQGAQVVCLQELFYGPYFCQVQDNEYYSYSESIPDGPTTVLMQEVAERHGVV